MGENKRIRIVKTARFPEEKRFETMEKVSLTDG